MGWIYQYVLCEINRDLDGKNIVCGAMYGAQEQKRQGYNSATRDQNQLFSIYKLVANNCFVRCCHLFRSSLLSKCPKLIFNMKNQDLFPILARIAKTLE